jgi:N-acetylglucosamine-6-phosphate deacetylase
MTTIFAPSLFDGDTFRPACLVTLADGRIDSVAPTPRAEADIVLPEGSTLAPGYVDLQVNGGGGHLLNDSIDLDTMARIAAAHAAAGTTSLLPTLISGTRGMIREALDVGAEAVREISGVIGLHIEGPFLSPARPGIHPPANLIPLTDEDEAMLSGHAVGHLLLTLAPEIVGLDRVAALRDAGIVVFAGHTDATAEQATAAFDGGVIGCTHLFNAMSQMGSRAPGVVGAALAHARVAAGLICDGLHVHPVAMRAAFAAMGPRRLFLVSDAMPTAASDRTEWTWQGETIHLTNGRLARADGTLAGAHITMAESVRNAVALCGIAPADALRMATSTPADVLRDSGIGRIARGRRADLIALDDRFRVMSVWRAGRPHPVFAGEAPV